MALTPARKTYAQLTAATDVQDSDLLASYRSSGPLKKLTALVYKTYARVFSQSGTGASTSDLQTELRRIAKIPEQYGAAGDGSTNDATALTNCFNAAVAAGVPVFLQPGKNYRSNTSITLPAGLVLEGYGATISTAANNITLLAFSGSNITIRGLTVSGPVSAYSGSSYGIKGGGTSNTPSVAPVYVSNVNLIDVKVSGFGSGGVWYEYVQNWMVTNLDVRNCGWHGFIYLSCKDFRIDNPYIDTIYPNPLSGYNAYGIGNGVVNDTNDTVRYPQSERGIVSGGIVRNIPNWHGLDMHGGIDIVYDGTLVIDCKRAAIITYANFRPPIRCSIRNITAINTYALTAENDEGGTPTEKRGEAFWITGDSTYPAEYCSMVNCYAYGHGYAYGNYALSNAYGIYVGPSVGSQILNLSLVNCLAGGIFIDDDAETFLVQDCVIDSPYTTAYPGGAYNPTNVAPRYVEVGPEGAGIATGTFINTRMLKNNPTIGDNVGFFGWLIRAGSGIAVKAYSTLMDGPAVSILNTGTADRFEYEEGSKTHDFGSLADGAGETTTVTVYGAALGDYAVASLGVDLQGMMMTAYVSAADTVSVRVQNETGGTIDLASSTLRARIIKTNAF